MKCVICQKGPMNGVTLYRINAKGQPGLWACDRHYGQTDGPPRSEENMAIVRVLEGKKP